MVSNNFKYAGDTLGMNVLFNDFWINEIVPVFDLWVGRQDILFAETRVFNDYHYLGTRGVFQVGIGSGFGHIDKSIGRAGVSLMPSIALWGDRWYTLGAYFGGDFLVKNKATIRGESFYRKVSRCIGGRSDAFRQIPVDSEEENLSLWSFTHQARFYVF